MVEEVTIIIATIIIVLLGQLNILSQSSSEIDFVDQFVRKGFLNAENFNRGKDNRSCCNDSLSVEGKLQPLPLKVENASEIKVSAKSALVLDAGTNTILYSKNHNEEMPVASLTKIMTALVVLENADLNGVVTISKDAAGVEVGEDKLFEGETIKAKDLLKMMLVESNNAAAVSLAEYSAGSIQKFVRLMNKKAGILGLKDTFFYNPTGLDEKEKSNYSTAYEMARLVNYALEKPLIWDILRTQNLILFSADGKTRHKIRNTNLLLGKMENIVGGKTGFTDKAGECLMLVIEDPSKKHKIISVVLNADDRFLETEKLVKWVFRSYEWW
jgi:D-alanyl-D-alanine carboxypeptidase